MLRPLEELGFIEKSSTPGQGSCSFRTTWGMVVQTKSTAQDMTQLASYAPDLLLMVEAAQQPHSVYEKCVERALEKDAHIIISGTLEKAHAWYGDYYRKWQGQNTDDAASFSIPSWSNERIFPGGRDDPKIKLMESRLSPEKFQERCAAIPYKADGLVHPAFDAAIHVAELQVAPDYPVELAIDPGFGGAYAVLFVQKIGQLVNVLDEVYVRREIAQDVIPLVKDSPFYHLVKEGVIDIAAKQRHANKSQIQIWAEDAPEISLRCNYVWLADSIEAVNLRLKVDKELERPYLQFNSHLRNEKTEDGRALGVLGEFDLRKWRPNKEGSSESKHPVLSNDHALNALGYYLYDVFGPLVTEITVPPAIQRSYWNEQQLPWWQKQEAARNGRYSI
jgi:hypothetical protein